MAHAWNRDKTEPVLLAEPNPRSKTQWRAWCPFCRRYHFHGAEEGHRAAHCASDDSPFKMAGGYHLVLKASRVLPRPSGW